MQKRLIIKSLLFVAISTFFFQACKEELEDYVPKEYVGPNASFLRIINTISIPRRLNYYVNDTKINGDSLAYNASFPTSEFVRVAAGTATFKATIPATGTDIYSTPATYEQGKYHTLFLIDTLPTIDSYSVTDNELVPPSDSGKALIRFVHVGKGVGSLSMANTTVATAVDTVIKSVGYKMHSPFIKVNSGAGQRFQLFTAGTSTKVGVELTAVTLTPNRIYTFYVRGRSGVTGTYAPTLGVFIQR